MIIPVFGKPKRASKSEMKRRRAIGNGVRRSKRKVSANL